MAKTKTKGNKHKKGYADKSQKPGILDRDISKFMDKAAFIVKRYFGIICILPAILFMLILFTPFNYPDENELVYEEYTYLQYEYVYHDNLRNDYEEYHIYVEEYDEPLEISDTTFDEADRTVLANIKTGEKVTLSIDDHFGTPFLYTMRCGDSYVLTYEDYLSEHIKGDKKLVAICILCLFIGITMSSVDIIYKKIKGKSLFWSEK